MQYRCSLRPFPLAAHSPCNRVYVKERNAILAFSGRATLIRTENNSFGDYRFAIKLPPYSGSNETRTRFCCSTDSHDNLYTMEPYLIWFVSPTLNIVVVVFIDLLCFHNHRYKGGLYGVSNYTQLHSHFVENFSHRLCSCGFSYERINCHFNVV